MILQPLRLIIMSATLRVSDFASNPTLFPLPPPVLHITTRQHPVTLHFSRRTSHDYIEEAYKKVARIHARLPAGGILVFCTGQNEIVALVKKLEAKFGKKAIRERKARALQLKERLAAREAKKEAKEQTAAFSDEDESDESESSDGEGALAEALAEAAKGDDLEVEDVELGQDRDLAADVDDGLPLEEDDPEGLESSDDEDSKIAGLDLEEDTEGELTPRLLSPQPVLTFISQSPCTFSPSTRSCRRRSR